MPGRSAYPTPAFPRCWASSVTAREALDALGDPLYSRKITERKLRPIVTLPERKQERVVDVRETPLSRKRGFSKSALREKLEDEGSEYVHLRELGSPRAMRHKLREDRDYQSFFRAFSTYLENNLLAIEEAYQYVRDATRCLLCLERLPDKCHRSMVAEKIKERDGNGLKVVNI